MEKLSWSWFLLPVAAVIMAMIVLVAITQLPDARNEVPSKTSVDAHVNAQAPDAPLIQSPCTSYLCQNGKARLEVCTSDSGVHNLQWSFRSGDEFVGTDPYQERPDYDIEKYIGDNLCIEE